MKNLIFILIAFLFLGCSSLEIKNKNLIRPEYKFQKSYVLRQSPADFINYFDVWKYDPIDFADYASIKELNEAKLFTAYEKITLVGGNYIINDKVNKKKYELKQIFAKEIPKDTIKYEIFLDDKVIATIIQPDPTEKLNFNLIYNEKTYILTGVIKNYGIDVHSFEFTISHNTDVIGSIFKQYSAVANNFEIYINRQFRNIEDSIFICLAVFVHHILKENGYQYK
jgi:hypothetical protein